MAQSKIEWTEFTVNPIRARWADRRDGDRSGHACEKVSPGCRFCYSSQQQHRFGLPRFDEAPEKYTNGEIELYLDEAVLRQVLRRKKPTRYFWCSMTDMFWRLVPDEWIDQCFAVMALTPQHTHMVLTKRAERMSDHLSDERRRHEVGSWASVNYQYKARQPTLHPAVRGEFIPWPLPNVQLGVSTENQKYADERIPWLLKTPAAVRFISYEPALGPVDLWDARYKLPDGATGSAFNWGKGISLVISGGESGTNARPAHPQWFRDVRDQCAAAGVKFFHKQNGEYHQEEYASLDTLAGAILVAINPADDLRHRKSLPTDALMVRVCKHAAGRLLDGRTHDELPQ